MDRQCNQGKYDDIPECIQLVFFNKFVRLVEYLFHAGSRLGEKVSAKVNIILIYIISSIENVRLRP